MRVSLALRVAVPLLLPSAILFGNLHRALADQVQRIAGIALVEYDFAALKFKNVDLLSDLFQQIGLESLKKPIVRKLIEDLRAQAGAHASWTAAAMPSRERIDCVAFAR